MNPKWKVIRKRDRVEEDKKPYYIRPFSKKRMKENRTYTKVRREYLEEYPECQAKISPFCRHEATDIHHKQKRRTEEQRLDINTWMGVCRPCHLWIESHDEQSRQLGFIENGLKQLHGNKKLRKGQ